MEADSKTKIVQFLRQRRERGWLVPSRLAEALEIQPSNVTMWLNGTRPYNMDHIDKTAAFFGLSVIDFLTLVDQEIKEQETHRPESSHEHTRATGTDGKPFRGKRKR